MSKRFIFGFLGFLLICAGIYSYIFWHMLQLRIEEREEQERAEAAQNVEASEQAGGSDRWTSRVKELAEEERKGNPDVDWIGLMRSLSNMAYVVNSQDLRKIGYLREDGDMRRVIKGEMEAYWDADQWSEISREDKELILKGLWGEWSKVAAAVSQEPVLIIKPSKGSATTLARVGPYGDVSILR